MKTQTLYQKAIIFAAAKHQEKEQKIPGSNIPYVVHLSNVAMEIIISAYHSTGFNLDFAVQVALLHDVLEDTTATFEELEEEFGSDIAQAVASLTKNRKLPKERQMADSLERIKMLSYEVWAVKMADRITNLQKPPLHWEKSKKTRYQEEARVILSELKEGNEYLSQRLGEKIEGYEII